MRESLSVANLHFSICNFQYFSTKGEFPCLTKRLKIDGLRA